MNWHLTTEMLSPVTNIRSLDRSLDRSRGTGKTTMVEVTNGGDGQTGIGTHTTMVEVPNDGAGKTTKVGGDNSFIDSEDIAKGYLTAVAADNDRSGFIPLDD